MTAAQSQGEMRTRRLFLTALTAVVASTGLLTASPAQPQAGAAATACLLDPHAKKASVRAMWIATVANKDWPSSPGLSIAQQKSELASYLRMAVVQRHNAVVLQVRPSADAFWPSDIEPWSKYLTGTAGRDPGYDPLAFAVNQAHRRNLEFHAWFNPFRVSLDTDRAALAASSPARLHPDWVVSYGGQLYYNPGIPAVRRLASNAIMDAVKKYNIDAVHLDDYFYPYPVAGTSFPDAQQYATYGAGYATRADWRRHNINVFIHQLSSRIKATKPWVKFGVSPFAIWRNNSTDPRGSDTSAGVETYDDLYADVRRWVRQSWLDYVAPQVYWARGFAPADYDKVTAWWAGQVPQTVQLFIGHATYKVGTSTQSPDWSETSVLSSQLGFNATVPKVKGDLYFSAFDVRANRLHATSFLNRTWYSHPALVPRMPWIDAAAPRPPRELTAGRVQRGVLVHWRAGGATTKSYAIYRVRGKVGTLDSSACVLADATHLLATRRSHGDLQSYLDPTAASGVRYTYVVTALDRLWNESQPRQVSIVG